MKPAFFELEELFAPIADTVDDFATKHQLTLKKCARGNAGWEMVGIHPAGGTVYLLLMYEQTLGLGIGSTWQFPSDEMGALYSHFRDMRACPIDAMEVSRRLDEEFRSIQAAKFGYWTHISPLQQSNDP